MAMNLTYTDTSFRKVVNGVTLAIEHGTTLGVSFLDHNTKVMRTFQLNSQEVNLLISFLNKYGEMPSGSQ